MLDVLGQKVETQTIIKETCGQCAAKNNHYPKEIIVRLLIILMTFSIGTANAGMYKCKDANGKTSYSQHPCKVESDIESFDIKKDTKETVAERTRALKVRADKKTAIRKVEAEAREERRASERDASVAYMNYKTARIQENAAIISYKKQAISAIVNNMNTENQKKGTIAKRPGIKKRQF